MKVERLSATLRKVLARRGLETRLGMYRILGQWEATVGTVIARHAQPSALRGRKLTIEVDSPVWMQQLTLLKPTIIEKVNDGLGKETVQQIILTLGPVASSRGRPAARRVALPPLSAAEQAEVDGVIGTITDPAVRSAVRQLLEKDLRSKKAKRPGAGR